jgi:Flp pilus assembly protein TadB
VTIVLLGVVAAVLAWPARPRPGRRLAAVTGGAMRRPGPARSRVLVPAVLAATVAVLTVGIRAVLVAAVLGAVLVVRRARPVSQPDPRVPLVVDLLGSCLRAGAPMSLALQAAAEAASGPTRDACLSVAEALASGAPAESAWSAWLANTDLATVARVCLRAAESGAAGAHEIHRVAARLRSQRRAELTNRAKRAATWVVLPLGLCFLPAFVLVGVVPLALGLAAGWR